MLIGRLLACVASRRKDVHSEYLDGRMSDQQQLGGKHASGIRASG
jgi:hypothetical protein